MEPHSVRQAATNVTEYEMQSVKKGSENSNRCLSCEITFSTESFNHHIKFKKSKLFLYSLYIL